MDQPRAAHCSHEWSWVRRPARRFLLPDWLAITIGHHVISWRPLDDAELAHELKHVEQWARYGLRFIPRYLAAGRRAAAAGGDRYRDNPFEIEARAAAEAAKETGRAGQASDPRSSGDRRKGTGRVGASEHS